MLSLLAGLLDLIAVGALLGACVYESVVMAPNYAAHIPASLVHIRAFFRARTPAHFFRAASALSMLLVLGSILASWGAQASWFFGGALLLLVAADAVTFFAHYPRNKILFLDPLADDTESLTRVAQTWGRWNLVRVFLLALVLASVVAGVLSLGFMSSS